MKMKFWVKGVRAWLKPLWIRHWPFRDTCSYLGRQQVASLINLDKITMIKHSLTFLLNVTGIVLDKALFFPPKNAAIFVILSRDDDDEFRFNDASTHEGHLRQNGEYFIERTYVVCTN